MSEGKRIRIVLVDDHEMVRSGLAIFLRAFDDLELAGQAATGSEALEVCAETVPDVVLMDLIMPEMDGIEAIRRLRAQHPHLQVIALTSFPERELVQQALAAGAIGFILKNTSVDELADAIRSAYQGKPVLAPEAFRVLVEAPPLSAPRGSNLTPREREVLGLLTQGLSNQKIAERLVLNISTIKTHVSNILSKLGVANRVEAVTLALQHNLVSIPSQD